MYITISFCITTIRNAKVKTLGENEIDFCLKYDRPIKWRIIDTSQKIQSAISLFPNASQLTDA